jgi:hypothetical protein
VGNRKNIATAPFKLINYELAFENLSNTYRVVLLDLAFAMSLNLNFWFGLIHRNAL